MLLAVAGFVLLTVARAVARGWIETRRTPPHDPLGAVEEPSWFYGFMVALLVLAALLVRAAWSMLRPARRG